MNRLAKQSFIITVLFSFLLFSMGGVMKANNTEKTEKRVFTVGEDPESALTIHGAGKFFLEIPSNPTTGYSWAVEKPADETIVAFINAVEPDNQEKETGQPVRLGAPSTEMFAFDALKTGKTTIKLNYRRPWEKNTPPIKTCTIQIEIL